MKPRRPLRKIVFNVPTRRDLTIGEKAVEHGLAIAAGIKQCKDVGNMPPNICTPQYLADQAQLLAETRQISTAPGYCWRTVCCYVPLQ